MAERTVRLYHGTTRESASALLAHGWSPERGRSGGNMGQHRFLYLSTDPEDALWFAQEKGCDAVLEVQVPIEALAVDPEDGIGSTVEEEMFLPHGLPGKLVARLALPASAFMPLTAAPRP